MTFAYRIRCHDRAWWWPLGNYRYDVWLLLVYRTLLGTIQKLRNSLVGDEGSGQSLRVFKIVYGERAAILGLLKMGPRRL